MGYHTRPELILDNLELLAKIKTEISAGREIRFRVKDDRDISSEQYRLRRLLAATDRHRSTYGGEFAGLGAATLIRIEPEKGVICLKPKGGVDLEEWKPDENSALEFLGEQEGSLAMVEFVPSKDFDVGEFVAAAATLGWTIIVATRVEDEDGKVTYAAEKMSEREEEFSGFDFL